LTSCRCVRECVELVGSEGRRGAGGLDPTRRAGADRGSRAIRVKVLTPARVRWRFAPSRINGPSDVATTTERTCERLARWA
jgi:hypothetical protein